MNRMPKARAAWGRPGFKTALLDELGQLRADELPLQAGLASGSHALENPRQCMVIAVEETAESIRAKVGIFYSSVMPGCACAGDPTVEDERNEYCMVQVIIDKATADTTIKLVNE